MDAVSKALSDREIVDQEEIRRIKKMEEIYSDSKAQFQKYLKHIKDSNLLYTNPESMILMKEQSRESSNQQAQLQEELIGSLEIENVIEQQDFVNERHKNIQEIDRAINVINTMSSQMLQLTLNDGLKIEGFMKQHKEHQVTVETKINPELQKANAATQQQLKNTCCLGVMAVILAGCIVAMIYFMVKNGGK